MEYSKQTLLEGYKQSIKRNEELRKKVEELEDE